MLQRIRELAMPANATAELDRNLLQAEVDQLTFDRLAQTTETLHGEQDRQPSSGRALEIWFLTASPDWLSMKLVRTLISVGARIYLALKLPSSSDVTRTAGTKSKSSW